VVFEHLTHRPNESIGVAALNRKQADLIEQLIEQRRMVEQGKEDLFARDRPEPFFVKNLENVQGDERDHIILSMTYGPPPGVRQVYQRFGPINRDGGSRRINVLITRARSALTVIHSMT